MDVVVQVTDSLWCESFPSPSWRQSSCCSLLWTPVSGDYSPVSTSPLGIEALGFRCGHCTWVSLDSGHLKSSATSEWQVLYTEIVS